MRGTDYQFPAEWPSMTPEEKDAWFHQERCRRQAMRQETAFRYRMKEEIRRETRRRRYSKTAFLGRKE